MLEIALLATWIWVAVSVILDVYRSPDLAPAAKASWIFVIVLMPLLGVMIYVIARGDKMRQHEIGGERQLEDLRDRGVLKEEEFRRRRAHHRCRGPSRSRGLSSDGRGDTAEEGADGSLGRSAGRPRLDYF